MRDAGFHLDNSKFKHPVLWVRTWTCYLLYVRKIGNGLFFLIKGWFEVELKLSRSYPGLHGTWLGPGSGSLLSCRRIMINNLRSVWAIISCVIILLSLTFTGFVMFIREHQNGRPNAGKGGLLELGQSGHAVALPQQSPLPPGTLPPQHFEVPVSEDQKPQIGHFPDLASIASYRYLFSQLWIVIPEIF